MLLTTRVGVKSEKTKSCERVVVYGAGQRGETG